MPPIEYLQIGEDGKVHPGVTVLRDPQTGELFDVVTVLSGRDFDRPFWPGQKTESNVSNTPLPTRTHGARGQA